MALPQISNKEKHIAIVTQPLPGAAAKGAAEPKVEQTFPFTPRGLLRAVRALPEHQKKIRRCNGNTGVSSWVEVAGHRISAGAIDSLVDFVHEDDVRFRERMFLPVETRTTKAKKIIANALSA
jgi:hypothetical protein